MIEQHYTHKLITDILLWSIASFIVVVFYVVMQQHLLTEPFQFRALFHHPWLSYLLIAIVLKSAAVWGTRTYLQNWRYISFRDVEWLLIVIAACTLLLALISYFLFQRQGWMLTIPILDGLITLALSVGVRVGRRELWDRVQVSSAKGRKNFLILGAGDAGTMLARELQRQSDWGRIIGFLDDDPKKAKQSIAGVRVLGTIDDLERVVMRHHIDQVFITMPSANNDKIRAIVTMMNHVNSKVEHKIDYKIMPSVAAWLSGKVSVEKMREVRVEDLLQRDPITLDEAEIEHYLRNKVVLVTGAGGSIGSEIARQVLNFQPKQLLLLGRGENSVYSIKRELNEHPHVHSIIADVRSKERLKQIFSQYQPQVVFHAAAHKHVPFMEDCPEEAILNNVVGTKNVLEQAVKHNVDFFVNISTDKAVNPTSVMGASKRVAEWLVCDTANKNQEKHFVSVRFGNVLGSRGSVIPLFKKQIVAGGPVTVTHAEMIRYFMTIPEAAQLVLQAGGIGSNGSVYVLDMGEPVKILDLAKDLITLSGFEPYEDIDIAITGMRPGEKLYEELLTDKEQVVASQHSKIFVAESENKAEIAEIVCTLIQAANDGNEQHIYNVLNKHIKGATLKPREA